MTEAAERGTVLVVADDLTGANATAAGLARARLRAVTVTDADHPEVVAEFVSRFDAVVVSANNRHATPEAAADDVRRAVRAGWPATLVANRIDSTLRGNIGATTQALVEELRDLVAGPVVALCVPAHPDAQRQTVAGVQLLAGRRLEETELAADPRSPIARSDVAGLLAAQTDLPIVSLPLETVTGPVEGLVEALAEAVRSGAGIVVADALTLDHVDRVAAAAVRVERVTWLSVDPGPATVALARALGLGSGSEGSPYLAVSGSATDLTRRQLARLQAVRPVHVVRLALDADGLPDADATTAALVPAIAAAGAGEVVLLASALGDGDLLAPAVRSLVPAALARAARRALESERVDGLYLTGGDLAAACFTELAADGLDVADEVVPLAVAGSFVGGPWSGLPVVTKGGLVGDDDTTVACLAFLEQAAEAGRRHVQPARTRVR
ncbi:four-carbon acid sugar kinase family protein [Nocardioides euryhalodurans]|uniref:Four-carbon acid sugar kinase family protein n=1 Tax=Nocardioides euryhalodurans TaxID=2518370 RepID=A0A4P7GLW0_9ACTN|nr:four-carbon acid sugar kinase family protein [Nocardioides euryhalodurans]QBR93096.1 four-carbon acid sugar kinase family protein [Nocardioides euryhalodurans]